MSVIKPIKIYYVISKDTTTILWKDGKEKEHFKNFKGKLKFKNKNPTEDELIKLISEAGVVLK